MRQGEKMMQELEEEIEQKEMALEEEIQRKKEDAGRAEKESKRTLKLSCERFSEKRRMEAVQQTLKLSCERFSEKRR